MRGFPPAAFLCVLSAGTTQPGQLCQHLHGAGGAELPAERAAAARCAQQLQAAAARCGRLHDLRQHQGAEGGAQSALSLDGDFSYRTKYVLFSSSFYPLLLHNLSD